VWTFDASGRLLADQDSYGNRNSMSYGAGSPTSPSSAVNSGGRALTLGYTTGQLTAVQSPAWASSGGAQGQQVTYGYNGAGQLTSTTRGAGSTDAVTTTFGYSGTLLTGITTASGRTWSLGYDGAGRVSGITSPVAGTAGQPGYTPAYTTGYSYTPGQTVVVQGVGTSGALTTTYTLDGQGQPITVTDGLGHSSGASYDVDHDVTRSQDANGNQTTNAYQYVGPNGAIGLITQTVQPPIQPDSPLTPFSTTIVTTRTYDPQTYDLIEVDKPAGGVTRYQYDGHHSVIATAELTATTPLSSWRGTLTQYDAYGERTSTTDGRGVNVDQSGHATLADPQGLYTSHQGYDTQGDLTSASTPPITTTLNGTTTTAPVTTTYTDDGDGNQLTAVSANGATTSDGYDHLGRQITTTEPSVTLYDGTTTTPVETTGYDADGNAVRTTDALDAVTTSSYDPLGRQISTTNPVSGTTLTTYNATEQVSVQAPQGNTTTSNYDAAGRLIQATDALTGTVQYGYDDAGNTLAITTGDTSGAVIQVETRQYDALNRTITDTVTGPGGTPQTTTTRYDVDGNVYQVNQPTGATTVDTYDLADDLVTVETDGAPVLSATHQDQTTYRYDAAGNQVETIDPDGRDTTISYDGDNRVAQSVAVTSTGTLTTTLGYDPDGNTLQTTTQTQSRTAPVQTSTDTATYNAADWTASVTDNGVTTNYGYDAAGRQRTQTYQNGAATATMALDAEGRLTALGDGAGHTSAFAYNANDQTTAITLPNGVSEQASYDANGRLTAWHDPGPGQNVTYGYAYDAASRITSFTAISGTDTVTHYPQGWLHSDCGPQVIAQSPDHCYHWTYDSAGNITAATVDAGSPVTYTYTYNPQTNELTTLYAPAYANSTTHYGYDGSGNTTSITSPVSGSLTAPGAINTHLGYNPAGQVNSITLKDGRTIAITYNTQGQRASYSALSATGQTLYSALFAYSGGALSQASVVSATAGGSISYTDSYLDGGDGQPIAFIRQQGGSSSFYWYEYDGRGNVVSVTDINGNVVDSYEYDLWGEEITDTSHEAVPQRLRFGAMWYDEEMQVQWLWDNGRYYDPELERYLQPDAPGGSYIFAGDDPSGLSRSGISPHVSGIDATSGPDLQAREAALHVAGSNGGLGKITYRRGPDGCPGSALARIVPDDVGKATTNPPSSIGGGYEAGHLIAASLAGPSTNSNPENFVAQTVNVNHSSFARVENVVRKLTRQGYGVLYAVVVDYGQQKPPRLHGYCVCQAFGVVIERTSVPVGQGQPDFYTDYRASQSSNGYHFAMCPVRSYIFFNTTNSKASFMPSPFLGANSTNSDCNAQVPGT